MILTCPQCQTRYQADASKFGAAGRNVRCAKCGHVWREVSPGPPPPAPAREALAPEHIPEEAPSAAAVDPVFDPDIHRTVPIPTEPHRKAVRVATSPFPAWPARVAAAAGWLVLVAIVLLIGWSALVYRQQIASVWPQSSSVYAALGLHVNTRGLDFTDVAYRRETQAGRPVLAISGKLVNIGSRELSVPAIEVTLTDASKRTLYHWTFNAKATTLEPGQTAAFLTRLSSPPSAARHLELRLADNAQ